MIFINVIFNNLVFFPDFLLLFFFCFLSTEPLKHLSKIAQKIKNSNKHYREINKPNARQITTVRHTHFLSNTVRCCKEYTYVQNWERLKQSLQNNHNTDQQVQED